MRSQRTAANPKWEAEKLLGATVDATFSINHVMRILQVIYFELSFRYQKWCFKQAIIGEKIIELLRGAAQPSGNRGGYINSSLLDINSLRERLRSRGKNPCPTAPGSAGIYIYD